MTAADRDPISLTTAVLSGDRRALPRLLSVVERGGDGAREVGRRVYARGGSAYTVGVTGPPGAGKSTLTDQLVASLRSSGSEVAVLAVDPSSPFSGGAFLGDRVRLMDHALDPGVYMRSVATRGHLGGLSLAVPELIRVLDAAGFPSVLVETVGVGQSEVEIAGSADTTMVVLTPGAGDSVQANKAGLLEVADLFVINKADHPDASQLERDLTGALDLTAWADGWRPPIVKTVATLGDGVIDLMAKIGEHREHLVESGLLEQRRTRRALTELRRVAVALMEDNVREAMGSPRWQELVGDVAARRIDPWAAADAMLQGLCP
ncbi:MAG: methylmalonyl Co-A mutase-associated GTPase MeaB [Acidimicrobiales bacterium]